MGEIVEFPVVSLKEFPYGLQCLICNRSIHQGQPYASHLIGMNGDCPIVAKTCVYCNYYDVTDKKLPILKIFAIIVLFFIIFIIILSLI